MNLKNWRENIVRTGKLGNSKYIVIPMIIANDMGIEVGDYMKVVYDDQAKEIKVTKNN